MLCSVGTSHRPPWKTNKSAANYSRSLPFKHFLPGPTLCHVQEKESSRVLSSPSSDEPRTRIQRIQPTSGVHACGAVCFHFRFLTPKNATYSPRVQVHVLHCHCPACVFIFVSGFLFSTKKRFFLNRSVIYGNLFPA